jgi:hypothetical protein
LTPVSQSIDADGILDKTHDGYSPIDIENSGDFTVSNAVRPASGIYGRTLDGHSPLSIVNSGDLAVTGASYGSFGILGYASGGYSPVSIVNGGDVRVTSTAGNANGIAARLRRQQSGQHPEQRGLCSYGSAQWLRHECDDVYRLQSREHREQRRLHGKGREGRWHSRGDDWRQQPY